MLGQRYRDERRREDGRAREEGNVTTSWRCKTRDWDEEAKNQGCEQEGFHGLVRGHVREVGRNGRREGRSERTAQDVQYVQIRTPLVVLLFQTEEQIEITVTDRGKQ
jgi:hypothetical protein